MNMDYKPANLGPLLPFLGVALFAYVFRLLQSRKKVSFLSAMLEASAAVFSGVLTGSIVEIYPSFPLVSKIAIAGLASFIGPDLIGGLLTIGGAFKSSPEQFLLKYIYAFKGVKTGMDIPTPIPPPMETTSPKAIPQEAKP